MGKIATVNKDEILYQWIVEGLGQENPVLFQFLQVTQGWGAVAPIPSEESVKTYINGDKQREYNFMLQIAFMASDDSGSTTNTDNMMTMRQWQDWIDAQEEAGNYPDFGEKCSNYKLENLADMPTMAGRQEDGMAKYQFPARLSYLEKRG